MPPRPDREEYSLGRDRYGREVSLTREYVSARESKWKIEREPYSQLDERVVVCDLTDAMIRKLGEIGAGLTGS